MFWLKKLLGDVIAPLPIGVFLITVGALLRWRNARRPWGRRLVLLGIALPLIASNRGLADWWVSGLEDQFSPPGVLTDVRYIAVLGGGHADNARLPWTSQLHESSRARLMEAVRRHRQIPSAILICCGPRVGRTHSHAAVLAGAAAELGVDPAKIRLLAEVRDTHDEVHAIREIVGDDRVALVTSAWHLPRAMGLARQAGLDAVACPADYLSPLDHILVRRWFEFSLEGLAQSTRAHREYLGLLWTKWRGQR